jgi:hypothetical protein
MCSAFNYNYTSSKVFLKLAHLFTVVEQLDRFGVVVLEKAFSMLRSELPNFVLNP